MRAPGGVLRALRDFLLTKVDREQRPGRQLGLEATDVTAFDQQIARLTSLQTGFTDWRDERSPNFQKQTRAVSRHAPSPAGPLSDAEHGRNLVTGIAGMHDVTLFARLSHPEAATQSDILHDMLAAAQIAPYRLDADTDPGLVLGLPLSDDHPAPLVLYIGGRVVGDFIAATDALRDGTLGDRLSQAGITFDATALRALQDSLQKA